MNATIGICTILIMVSAILSIVFLYRRHFNHSNQINDIASFNPIADIDNFWIMDTSKLFGMFQIYVVNIIL